MRIETIEFECVHGKKPRGNGMWLFANRRDILRSEFVFECYGSYTEAKKKAIEYCKSNGLTTMYVLG